MDTTSPRSESWLQLLHLCRAWPMTGISILTRRALMGLLVLVPALLHAAVSNVVVWTTARTTGELGQTLQNGYPSMTNMRLWWKCDSGANVGWDSTGNAKHGKLHGTVAGISMLDPFGVTHTVASGFNAPFCYMVTNPGIAPSADRTYEFWIRNPSQNNSVFFSILRSETGQVRGGQPSDVIRMWVNANGSLTIADRGTALQTFTSGALTWDVNKWYQISVVYDATGTTHTVKVYRAERNVAFPSPLFNYTSGNVGTEHWLAIGGHEKSYQTAEQDDTGMEGFLGPDGNGSPAAVTPEMYGANGSDTLDDTAAWRRACAVLSAHGYGTLTLTAGKTYYVGKESVLNDSSAETKWYQHEQMGWVVGARGGKVTVNGNGATVKLNPGLHFGSYDPLTGAAVDKLSGDAAYRDFSADIGNLLHFEGNLDVEVTNIKFDGNLTSQIWGGKYGDKGYQSRQSGLYFRNNDNVLAQNTVHSSYNALDGIGVLNEDLDELSPLKKVTLYNITARHNGRQGLSYNCGNHLEIYDSDFSYTGRTTVGNPAKLNYPGAGIDLEPMGRYMRPHTTIIENCTMFDNRENGLLLTGSAPAIIRDSTIWQSTGGRAVYIYGDTSLGDKDEDHFFIRCSIYGQVYSRLARRVRFEECSFIQANTAYYGPLGTNVPVYNRPALETTSTAGASVLLNACNFNITQNNGSGITRSAYAYNTVIENSIMHHANARSGTTTGSVSVLNNTFLLNTRFTEAGFSAFPTYTYYVDDGTSGTQSLIGPGVVIEGPTPGANRYISWSSSAGTRPLQPPTQTIASSVTWQVLTPNAVAGEVQAANNASYTASPAFTNPADSSGTRLFDKDLPADDWSNAVGINWADQTVTVNLGQTRTVRSVKLRMKHSMTQRPRRVYVSIGNGASTWTTMGVLRPNERDNATNADTWYYATMPAAISGTHVKLEFENDGLWGWYINEVKVYGN